ncbi:YajG family lipoprotein [Thermodesulfobacteriota bacterium]
MNEANVGRGQIVYVEVDDERPRNAFGTKVPTGGGEITPIQDPKEVVTEALVLGLTRLGFKPVLAQNESNSTLRAELRAIDYKVTQGFWAGGLTVDVALKGICIVDGQRKYEKLHRGHYEASIMGVQTTYNNELYINDALSQAINKVLSDRELIQCLTVGGTP